MNRRTALWSCLVGLIAIAALLGASPGAHAYEFWYYSYYGEKGDCWQTGTHGASTLGCDAVSSEFMPARMVNGGIGQNIDLTPSGDYCSSYVGDALTGKDSTNEGGATGFTTPEPFGNYQEWDGNNVCQANLTSFGEVVRKSACTLGTCGMHHYVSFHEQGYNNRPWEKSFGNPELVISTEADIALFSGSTPGGWGYVCPIFQDMQPPHDILEYCLQEWRGADNEKPASEDERIGSCAYGPESNALDTVGTYFYPTGTTFATEDAGSANTEVASYGWKKYKASITAEDLKHAIEYDQRPYKQKPGAKEANPEIGYGCGRKGELSSEPKEFALIGVEQGAEAWSFSEIGASEANLQLKEEFSQPAPEVTTEEAPEHPEGITLNGSVNPNGAPTTVTFEYGKTSVSESSIGASNPGTGITKVPESVQVSDFVVSPSTTYHYRISASNAGGETHGEEKTFTTPAAPTVTPVAPVLNTWSGQATLKASVNPHGAETNYYFEYGASSEWPSDKTKVVPVPSTSSSSSPVEVSAVVTVPVNKSYQYVLVAENAGGWRETETTLFELYVPVPRAATEAPAVRGESAVLKGDVNPNGADTTYYFEYGTTPSYGIKLPLPYGSDDEAGEKIESVEATGLTPKTNYYYRIDAENVAGISYGAQWKFTTANIGEPCTGTNLTGAGDPVLGIALHSVLTAGFNTSSDVYACNGTQGSKGKPTVAYTTTSSSAALASWTEKATAKYGASNAYLGTAEPPSAAKIAEIEANETTLVHEAVQTIPVAQIADTIIVNLPSGCTATSTSNSGRLVLNNTTLEDIFKGTINKWSEIKDNGDTISGTGCNTTTAITRIVPKVAEGTTHILKRYLGLIDTGKLETEKSANKTWNELAEGTESTTWPKAANVVKPAGTGENAVTTKVAETAGSIGFGNLAEVRASNRFSGTGNGNGTAKFWVPIQNGAEATYADPSSTKDVEKAASANCASTSYSNGEYPFPPPATSSSWSNVTTKLTETKYPLCSFAYVVALVPYSAFPSTEQGEATTLNNFLRFVTDKSGGQELIEKHDYLALAKGSVLTEAQQGAKEIGF